MERHPNGTPGKERVHGPSIAIGAALGMAGLMVATALAQEDIADILKNAKPATAPAPVTSPTAPEKLPTSDALGTIKPKAPEGSRTGVIVLNNGVTVKGQIWTTLDTPFRLWIEETQSYRDVDLSLVKRIDVKVISEAMEDDWRWLKEGSDQKVYSGKKYPNVELAYVFTLLNDQAMEGTVVAPVYISDGMTAKSLALYKKYKGKLDETLKDLVYIKSLTLAPPTAEELAKNQKLTTKLPLLEDK